MKELDPGEVKSSTATASSRAKSLTPAQHRAEMLRIKSFCQNYLNSMVPRFLRMLASLDSSESSIRVEVEAARPRHVYSAKYVLRAGRTGRREVCKLWVGLNVFHAYVVYFLPIEKDRGLTDIEFMFQGLAYEPEGQTWKPTWDETQIDGEHVAVLTFENTLPMGFVALPKRRMQVASEIATLTKGVIGVAERNGFLPRTKAEPDLVPRAAIA